MQKLANISLKAPNGDTLTDTVTRKELNTANLIIICLGQSKYATMADQWRAYDITKRLESGKDVELEDVDY